MGTARATRREEARIEASIFEGLYEKGLALDPELQRQLALAGYDTNHRELSYPPEVMDRCLDVAAEHFYPGLARAEAYRELGHRFALGFKETLIGAVVMAVFPLIGPDRLLARVAKSYAIGQNFGQTTLFPIERGHYRFEYRNGFPGISTNFDFTLGVFEALLRSAKAEPTIAPQLAGDGFDLDIRW